MFIKVLAGARRRPPEYGFHCPSGLPASSPGPGAISTNSSPPALAAKSGKGGLLDRSAWPVGTSVIVRREDPHPGAQFRYTDCEGHRFSAAVGQAEDEVDHDLSLAMAPTRTRR